MEREGLRCAVDVFVSELQQRWPGEIALANEQTTEYYALPFLFLPAFPSLTETDIWDLALYTRLFAGSILLQDKIIDGSFSVTEIPAASLRVMAMQAEAYAALRRTIEPDAPFWSRLRDYLADYASACVEEQRFVRGQRPFCEYTEDVGLRILLGKNGIARSVAAGLCEISREDRLFEPLVAMTDAFNEATQLWDDLEDWKEDLRRGAPSILLARIIQELPEELDEDAWRRLIAKTRLTLYYGGHVHHVLGRAIAALDRIEQFRSEIPTLGLYDTAVMLRGRCEALRNDIDRIVQNNIKRARHRPRLELSLPEPQGQWQRIAWQALGFLVQQWKLGFGEARDMTQYPEDFGFGPADTCYRGDVFQRALILDALCDVDDALRDRLCPVLEDEASYLLEQRLTTSTGGWRYFENLPELPPDADDLAQVIQALLRADRRADVVKYCEAPLTVLLRDNLHPDGSFETWIIPAAGRTPLEERHAALVHTIWTTGPDCDVIPNLLHALRLYDPGRFAKRIQDGVEHLTSRQRDDGTWPSKWYEGPYYGVYVALRFLTAVAPRSPTVARSLAFLGDSERASGGWGLPGAEVDALSTALALLGLSTTPDGIGTEARASRALRVLQEAGERDGGWPAQRFIIKGCQAYHGSRTLTTTFVLKAALAWHAWHVRYEHCSQMSPP